MQVPLVRAIHTAFITAHGHDCSALSLLSFPSCAEFIDSASSWVCVYRRKHGVNRIWRDQMQFLASAGCLGLSPRGIRENHSSPDRKQGFGSGKKHIVCLHNNLHFGFPCVVPRRAAGVPDVPSCRRVCAQERGEDVGNLPV